MTSRPAILAWTFFSLVYVYYVSLFYPGYYTADSIYTLKMGLGLSPLSNWHPALLSIIWGAIYKAFGRVELIWFIQIGIFFAIVAYLAHLYRNTAVSAVAAIVLLGWPPLITNMAAVWKDNWTIICLLGAVAFTKAAWGDKHFGFAAVALALATLAVAFRTDYVVVALPLVLALGWRLRSTRGMAGIGAVALAAMAAAHVGQESIVESRLNPWTQIAAWDIAGTMVRSTSPLPDVEINGRKFTRDHLRPLYSCQHSNLLVFGENGFPLNLPESPPLRDTSDEAREIRRAWLATVRADIPAYLRHRWCVGSQFLGIGVPEVQYPFPFGVIPNGLGIEFQRSPTNIYIYWFFNGHAHGPMWRLWIYLVATAAMCAALVPLSRDRLLPLALAVTVFAAAARVMILPAADFRYGLWIVVGSWLIAFELLDQILNRRVSRVTSSTRQA
jgi:hypothetical protein